MQSYIGTATSRVDGRAKVTGEAKYAGEFNVPGLCHGYIVEATIPKGRIKNIDTSATPETIADVVTGDAVVYKNRGGTNIGGLTDGTTYYVIVPDSTQPKKIKLAASQADATAG